MTLTARLAGLLLVALPVALAAGCVTPEPLVRLRSMATDAVWIAGRSVETKEKGGVRIAAAFDHQDERRIAFRVEFQNNGARAIDVGPDAMSFHTCEKDWSDETLVFDPEEALAHIDAQRSRETAEAENDTRAMAPLMFLSVVGDIATVASGNTKSTTGLRSAAIAASMDHDEARHANTIQQLGSAKEIWLNAAFRRTTLAPGQAAAGFVYIPIRKKARFVRLNVWAGDTTFTFMFKQRVTPV